MANTRYLTMQVEDHIRGVLSKRYGVQFQKLSLPLITGGSHEFDAVADDGSIVASVKSGSGKTSGGNIPSGKIDACIAELYFLTLVVASRRQLIFTTPDLHEIFVRKMQAKIVDGIEIVVSPLPTDIQAEVSRVQAVASAEVFPVLPPQT